MTSHMVPVYVTENQVLEEGAAKLHHDSNKQVNSDLYVMLQLDSSH